MRRNAYAMLRPYRVRDMCAAHSDPWRWAAGRQHEPTTAWAGAGGLGWRGTQSQVDLIATRRIECPNRVLSINHASCFHTLHPHPPIPCAPQNENYCAKIPRIGRARAVTTPRH